MDTETPTRHPQYPALVIDGSASSVFAGILGSEGQWLARSEQTGAPLEMLFPTVETVLQDAEQPLSALRSFIYCEGPGSVLGLRLCSMAIQTWSRLYPEAAHYFSYNTLQLCANLLVQDSILPEQTLIVSDWKKGAWNAVYITDGVIGETCVADDAAIADWNGALYHLPQRKGWQKPPASALTLAHAPGRLPEVMQTSTLLCPTTGVELYAAGVNTFAKWTPDRHRAS